MTTQEAYEGIREFFTRPGAVLAQSEGPVSCFYRGDSNPSSPVRCAVGCLIPDELYDPSFENTTASALLGVGWERGVRPLIEYFEDVDKHFLDEAQSAHDVAGTVEGFLLELDRVALSHGLTVAS